MLPTSGKHSKSSKPKNSKQPKSQGETESGSGRYRIPLNNPIMDGDSDSDDIGQETLPVRYGTVRYLISVFAINKIPDFGPLYPHLILSFIPR